VTPPRTSPAGVFQVLTSPGPAAIALIRVRGADAGVFTARHLRFSRTSDSPAWTPGQVRRAELLDDTGGTIDDILVSVHAIEPALDLRLHLHGNPSLVRRASELLAACGLTPSAEEQGTLWPTTDTLEAEAHALLPRMLTSRGAHWLLGQVGRLRGAIESLLEDDSPARVRRTCAQIADRVGVVEWFTRPARVALVGPPNVGKSTLANALADRVVSVVAPTPGTTRDWVEIPGQADGYPIVWLDTAGLRDSEDALELASAERTRGLMRDVDAIVAVLDVTDLEGEAPIKFLSSCAELAVAAVALNKSDARRSATELRSRLPAHWRGRTALVSAVCGTGLEELCCLVLSGLGRADDQLDQPAALSLRQARLLKDLAWESDRNAMRAKLLQVIHDKTPR